jgi:hypothetical protein
MDGLPIVELGRVWSTAYFWFDCMIFVLEFICRCMYVCGECRRGLASFQVGSIGAIRVRVLERSSQFVIACAILPLCQCKENLPPRFPKRVHRLECPKHAPLLVNIDSPSRRPTRASLSADKVQHNTAQSAYALTGKFKGQIFKLGTCLPCMFKANWPHPFHEPLHQSITPLHHAAIKARKAVLGKFAGISDMR